MMENPKKTSLENLLDDTLQGLIIPEKPTSYEFIIILALVLLFALIVFGLWKWFNYYQQRKQKAIRSLNVLAQEKGKAPQEMANKLSAILREGLDVPLLVLYQPEKKRQWQSFVNSLDTACYSNHNVSEADIKMLIKESRQWLVLS